MIIQSKSTTRNATKETDRTVENNRVSKDKIQIKDRIVNNDAQKVVRLSHDGWRISPSLKYTLRRRI